MNSEKLAVPAKYFFVGQIQHVLLLILLVCGTIFLAQPWLNNARWLGISETAWFYATLVVVVLHQVIGWLVFRSQLCFALLSRIFGKHDLIAWGIIFMPFLLLRPLLTLGLGMADFGSINSFRGIQITIGFILIVPVIYTLWSIQKFFGFQRALGGDHFRQKYREMPMVKKGAFKYSSNAMYTFVFLLFWAIALFTGSAAALAVALFQHSYIWIHWYCVEEPDMQIIYGNRN
jgi:hypothetical protein